MNWKKINNDDRVQREGKYPDWKQEIANDCYNQCVYCSIHEALWGGIDHFHIEHFRPQSKFEDLENTITNLYHACPICNRFKSDDWPSEPDLNKVSYPDPGDINYTDLFNLDSVSFTLVGKHVASNYLINKLYLNRPQLISERREQMLSLKQKTISADISSSIEKISDLEILKTLSILQTKIIEHLNVRKDVPPYRLDEIRR